VKERLALPQNREVKSMEELKSKLDELHQRIEQIKERL